MAQLATLSLGQPILLQARFQFPNSYRESPVTRSFTNSRVASLFSFAFAEFYSIGGEALFQEFF